MRSKNIRNLENSIARQEAHVERMIAANQPEKAVRAAKRVVFVFSAELALLKAGKPFDAADINAAIWASRQAVR